MQYKTQENYLMDLEVLKAFLSPAKFGASTPLSKDELDRGLDEQHIKKQAFETESVKEIAEQLAAVIHILQNPHEELNYSMLQERMQRITVLLQTIEDENIQELKRINSLLDQLDKQEKNK